MASPSRGTNQVTTPATHPVKTIAPPAQQQDGEKVDLTKSQKKRLRKVKQKKAYKQLRSEGLSKPLKKAAIVKGKDVKPSEGKPVAEVKPVVAIPSSQGTFKRIQDDITHYSSLFKQAEKLVREKESEYYAKL